MQIKSVIIDNIHYINFITFNISTLFYFCLFFFVFFGGGFLIWSAEIGVRLIHLCVLYAVKYGSEFEPEI